MGNNQIVSIAEEMRSGRESNLELAKAINDGLGVVGAEFLKCLRWDLSCVQLHYSTAGESAHLIWVRPSIVQVVSINATIVQLTQSKIPAPRKAFQLPSCTFLCTPSARPRRFTGAPPADVITESVYGRHSTSQPPFRKIISLCSGT